MEDAVVNVNGRILLNPADAQMPVFDRGFLYGDSIYEVVRTYGPKVFELEHHLARLENSAKLGRITLGQTRADYEREIERTLDAFRESHPKSRDADLYCRIIITRGLTKIGFGLDALLSPTQFVVIAKAVKRLSEQDFEKGMALKVVGRKRNDRLALDPAMKSGNYLNNLLAYLEATGEQFDDALLCNSDGFVTEGTTFNVFYVRRGIVATPPLTAGLLEGVTRRFVFGVLKDLGIPCRIVAFPKERLYEADEVFVTGTIREVFPVLRVDSHKPGGGTPGSVTRTLFRTFRERALAACR